MRNKLKQLRVSIGMTQAKIAQKTGVSQPNYQRWETGAAPIPADKLKKLAKALKTTPETILGKHPPIEAGFYDDSVGEDLNYYGEVSIHFHGSGAPLLLSISEGAFSRLHQDLQGESEFVTVESLANQTVVIRTKAIADLYFSSEACDDYGPEHETYKDHLEIQMPDPRDWEIVEALHCGDTEEFDEKDVKRVQKRIMITDEQYEKLVADGLIKPEDLDMEREKNKAETDMIFDMAIMTTYQLSTGQKRKIYIDQEDELFKAFYTLTDFGGDDVTDNLIHIAAEGRERIIFLNKSQIDYIVIPSHRYLQGRTELDAECLDEAA